MASDTSNGSTELPPVREAIIEQGLRLSQEVAAERDSLRLLLSERDTTIAGLKAQLQVAELAMEQMGNRTASMLAVRDDAVARRAEVEAVLRGMMALGRAFQIQSEPLIKEVEDEKIVSPPAAAGVNHSDVG